MLQSRPLIVVADESRPATTEPATTQPALPADDGTNPFRSVVDQLPVAVFVLDAAGAPFYANHAAVALLGKGIDPSARPDTLAETYAVTIAPSGAAYPADRMPVVRAMAGHESTVDDMVVAHPGGDVLLEVHGAPIFDDQGRVAYAVAVFDDITSRQRLDREQHRLAETQRLLLESSGDAIFGVDLDGCCIFINPAAADLLGYPAAEMLGRNVHATTHHSRPDGSPYPVAECPIDQAFRTGAAIHEADELLWRKDGTPVPVEYRSHPLMDNDEVLGAVVTFRDITERKQADAAARSRQEATELLAATDALTGLGNRYRAAQLLETLGIGDVVMMIDIDHFKAVNDEGGHAAGDAVLAELGAFLRTTLRNSDEAARWGGEEFLVVARGAGQGAQVAADRVVVGWRERPSSVTLSVGVAVHVGGSGHETLARADSALYQAKHLGRDRVVLGR